MTIPAFMDFGFAEIVLVGIVALLVFGGDLPDVMRTLGRSYAKFRRSLNEMSRPVRDEMRQMRDLPKSSNVDVDEYEYPELEVPIPGPEEPVDVRPGGGKTMGGAADEPPPV